MADINLGVGGANSAVAGGYDIANSLKLNSANSEYLYQTRDTSGSDWNRLKWTASMWVKHIPTPDSNVNPKERMFGAADANSDFDIRFRGEPLGFRNNSDVDGAAELRTTALYRDYSAWYHVVAVWDTANATAGDRMRLYVNGEEVTDFSVDTQPSLNAKSIWGKKNDGTDGNVTHTIGAFYNYYSGFSQGFNGYMAEIHWVEGQALTPTDFGVYDEDSGIWKPKAYEGTYGTNGFYLDFSNASNLGADASGNGNDWTLNNITSADQATDTPTNNFCTLNPLFTGFQSTVQLPLNGATQYGVSGGNQDLSYAGTMGVTKGKWYFENYINEVVATYGARIYVGFHTFQQDYDGVQVGASTNGDALAVWQMDAGNYVAWNGGSRSITSGLGTVGSGGAGKFVGIALNLDDNQISFYYDGSAVTNGTNLPLYNMGSQTDDGIFAIPVVQTKGSIQTANFGGYIPSNFISSAASDANGYGTFEYAPPSGYYALCTKNLAEYG